MMSEKTEPSIQLNIYSDVICPWCFVGKARLDEAARMLPNSVSLKTAWKPFELNPTMPADGADRSEYMLQKFGTADINQMQNRLSRAGGENGVKFNFDLIKRVPNTFNAHRLIWYAEKHGKQHDLSEILFRNYFVDGKDIGKIEVLLEAAIEAGLPEEGVTQFLNGNDGVAEVREEENYGRSLGIHAVPTFVLNGEVIASGAVPPDELVAAINSHLLQSTQS